MRTDIEADSRNSYEKFYRVSAYFFKNIRWIILKKPHKRKLMRKGSTEGEALCARVQGVQLPCAGQGRQPLPREVMLCVTSYWVLPDAEIGRIGSKAALLQSYACRKKGGEKN